MRRLLATVLVGVTVFAIYLALPEDGPANRVATCPVRVSEECQAKYGVHAYETVRFPVRRTALPDGGVEILLPRSLTRKTSLARECIEVVQWDACDLNPCATHPTICPLWDAGQPVRLARAASKFVIPDCRRPDGGWDDQHAQVDCLRDWGDGPQWFGCNVFPRAQASGAACLDAPTGVVEAGDRVEDSL